MLRWRNTHRSGPPAIKTLVAGLLAFMLLGCSGGVVLEPTEGPVLEARQVAKAAVLDQGVVTFRPGNPSEVALESSQLFFESAQVVILASSTERNAITRAGSIAVTLGAPLLLTAPPGKNLAGQDATDPEAESTGVSAQAGSLNTELLRLGTRAVLTVGEVSLHQLDTTSLVVQPVPENEEDLSTLLDTDLTTVPVPASSDVVKEIADLEPGHVYEASELGHSPPPYGTVPTTLPAERNHETIVLTSTTTAYFAGVATARAAGAKVFASSEPASLPAVVDYVADHSDDPVVGIGESFQNRAPFVRTVKALRTGVSLPSGAQRVFRADGRELTLVTVDADTAMEQRGIDTAADVIAEARKHAEEISQEWGVPTVPGIDVDPATTSATDLAYWASETASAGQYLLLGVPASMGGSALAHNHADLLRHPHVGMRVELTGPGSSGSPAVADLVAALAGIMQGEGLPQKLLAVDVGPKVDQEALAGGLVSTDSVAIAYTFIDGNTEQWDSAREALDPGTRWGVVTAKKRPKGKSSTARYPAPEDIMGKGDMSLLTFR